MHLDFDIIIWLKQHIPKSAKFQTSSSCQGFQQLPQVTVVKIDKNNTTLRQSEIQRWREEKKIKRPTQEEINLF